MTPRTFDPLPDTPLTTEHIDELRESDGIRFIRSIMMMSGGMVGLDSNEIEVTEDLVLSTNSKTILVHYQERAGWVIDEEVKHEGDDNPEEIGFDTWAEASSMAAEGLHEAVGDNSETE